MKKYLCVWHEGFPNTYNETIQIVTETFFNADNGYSVDDRNEIYSLQIDKSCIHGDGGHVILRLPNNFCGDFTGILPFMKADTNLTAFGYDVSDIMKQAKEDGFDAFTEDMAIGVLNYMLQNGDAGVGVNWEMVSHFIVEYLAVENENNSTHE